MILGCVMAILMALYLAEVIHNTRSKNASKLHKKSEQLRDTKGRFQKLSDSQVHISDKSKEKIKKVEKEIADLEKSEKYFSDL